jgi:hypothetical protein
MSLSVPMSVPMSVTPVAIPVFPMAPQQRRRLVSSRLGVTHLLDRRVDGVEGLPLGVQQVLQHQAVAALASAVLVHQQIRRPRQVFGLRVDRDRDRDCDCDCEGGREGGGRR